MEDFDSKFRRVAENIADAIRGAAGVQGRGDISVIVEDKGAIDQLVAEALGSTGLCVIVGVTGFSRRAQSGPVITGTLDMEFRVVEIPSVNRTEQGFVTAQQMAEWLAMNLQSCTKTQAGELKEYNDEAGETAVLVLKGDHREFSIDGLIDKDLPDQKQGTLFTLVLTMPDGTSKTYKPRVQTWQRSFANEDAAKVSMTARTYPAIDGGSECDPEYAAATGA